MSAMRSAYGWVLPASDRHFPKYLSTAPKVEGRRMYQAQHIQQSVQFCALRRTALDIGGHVGFWSYYLATAFAKVHAFEPNELFAQCFERNVRAKRVTLHRVALGEAERKIALAVDPENTGATHVRPGVEGEIPMRRLDTFGFDDVDFIKIDVEGAEYDILAAFEPRVLERVRWITGELHGNRSFELLEFLSRWFDIETRKTLGKRLFNFLARNRSV